MKAFALGLAFCCALATAGVRAQSAPLTLLEVSELDAEDTTRLRELLDRPSRVERLPAAEPDPIAYARTLATPDVLVLDRAHGRVSLVHAGDSEVLTRATGGAVSRSSYAVSFVAAELLTMAAQLQFERAHRFGLERVWLRGGVDLSWGGAPYWSVWRPSFALGGAWSRPVRQVGLAVELVAALDGHAEESSQFGEVRVRRHDLDVRGGPAYRYGALTLLGFGQLGLSIRHAEYTGPGGNSSQYFSGTVGAGLQLQGAVLPWFFLLAEVQSGVFVSRADFAVQGSSVVRESPWFGRAGIGVALALPVR